MKKTLILISLFVLCSAHRLFLKSDTYFLEPGQRAELYLFNGTFDASDNVITRDRIVEAGIVGPAFSFTPQDEDYYDRDDATYLSFQAAGAGTYLAGVSTRPRTIELSGEDFMGYLEHEGLYDLIRRRQEQGISGEAARERYAKHVKAIMQVGETRSDHFRKALGYPIEFIPLQNPYELSVGSSLSLRLLFDGRPLAEEIVQYGCRPAGAQRARQELAVRTDAQGECTIPIDQAGAWYVSAIHIEEKEGALDYASSWATLTFAIR